MILQRRLGTAGILDSSHTICRDIIYHGDLIQLPFQGGVNGAATYGHTYLLSASLGMFLP